MKSLIFLAALPSWSTAFGFNAYDLDFQGWYPRQHFQTADLEPPKTKITKWNDQCDAGNIFFTPRGPLVSGAARGPIITDWKGNLIWMENDEFEQAMNFQVQKYKGEDFLTFWHKDTKRQKSEKNKKEKKKDKKHKKKKNKDKKPKLDEPEDDEEVGEIEDVEGLEEDDEDAEFKTDKSKKDKSDKKSKNKDKKKKHKKVPKKSYVMLNSSYEVAHRIFPVGKGLKGDSHEFRITPQGTALITIYYKHKRDCTDLKLGKECWIQDGWFQEIDIETGDLIFEWRATDHIKMSDVFSSPNRKDGSGTSKKDAFDFFHINSVDKIDSGDYIISARYMHAVVCISGRTGEILWQLGGKNNNFKDLNHALDFAWQHHVSWQGSNTISLFDNHANTVLHGPSKHSKGMIIKLDFEEMTARLLGKFVHPDEILNVSQGSVQILPDSENVLVGFGNSPTFVEYTAAGKVLCAAHFAPDIVYEIVDFGAAKSYRVFKSPWVGRPKTLPDVVAKLGKVYVSWNGATEVTGWRLEMASEMEAESEDFVTIQTLKRDGFETSFSHDEKDKFVRVAALDASNNVMAYSETVNSVLSSDSVSFWLVMFGFGIFMLTFAAFVSLYQRFLPGFPKIARLGKARSFRERQDSQDFDDESDPLLLNEREPRAPSSTYSNL